MAADHAFLADKDAIRRALRLVTSKSAGKRVILAAYIGADPLTYIADPSGITIYCSNNPVGTNPEGIEQLLDAGCAVYFVPRLHAKVFWSARAGALIGSTNLSTNALGDGGLFETLYHTDDIDIDALLRKLRLHDTPIEVTPKVLEAFRRVYRRVHGHVTPPAVKRITTDAPTFEAWIHNRYRKPFSILRFSYSDVPDLTAKERAQVELYNEQHDTGRGDKYVEYLTCGVPVIALPPDEDVLCVHVKRNDDVLIQGTDWFRCELRTESPTGRGGKGLRTRLIQVRPRSEMVPFSPTGTTLKETLITFFATHPIPKTLEGAVIANGSRSERVFLAAATTRDG